MKDPVLCVQGGKVLAAEVSGKIKLCCFPKVSVNVPVSVVLLYVPFEDVLYKMSGH